MTIPTFTFADKSKFQQTLATQKAKVNNSMAYNQNRVFEKERTRRIKPSFQEVTGGTQMQLTFHHGRRFDREDLHAQDARKESERRKVLEREAEEREWADFAKKGKVSKTVFKDVGEGFVRYVAKPSE